MHSVATLLCTPIATTDAVQYNGPAVNPTIMMVTVYLCEQRC